MGDLWAQFVSWLAGRIGVPNGATTSDSFEEWLALMGRIEVPGG